MNFITAYVTLQRGSQKGTLPFSWLQDVSPATQTRVDKRPSNLLSLIIVNEPTSGQE